MKRMWSKNELKEIVKGTQGYNFANLVDKDGNPRFIEFEGVGIEQEGIEILYNKASLSGTHLLVVLALSVADSTIIPADSILTTFTLPKWIYDKIVPIQATIVTNSAQALVLRASDWSAQSADVILEKKSDNKITITFVSTSLTLTADRVGRVQIDLLIDNE